MLGLGVSVICAAAVDTLHALLSAVKARATTYENESATAALIDELKSEGILDKATILTTPTAHSDAVLHSLKDGTSAGDFDVSSDTDATRVNENGLLEDIAANQPRINYEPSASGVVANNAHVLLEPARTNDANYSQNASEWVWGKDSNANNTTRVDSQTDPYGGTSASQFTRDSGTSGWFANANNTTGSAVDYTHSIFVKQPASNASDTINMKNVSTSPQSQVTFTFSSESFTTESNATGSFEKFPNGYYRLSMTFANGSASSAQVRHTLDDGEALIVFGIQHEEGSYPTSYIPNLTTGQTTRAAETLTGSGNSTLINSTEGVLYAEIAALSDDGTDRCIALSDGTVDNRVTMLFGTSSNKIRVLIKSGGNGSFDEEYQVTSTLDYHKVAMKYKANDFALWIDGVERFTDTSGSSPSGLDQLVFNVASGTLPFYGKCKAVAVFNEALSDTELQNLTN